MNVDISNFTLSMDSFDVVIFHKGLMQLITCSLKWILNLLILYCALIVFTRFVQRNETTFSKFVLLSISNTSYIREGRMLKEKHKFSSKLSFFSIILSNIPFLVSNERNLARWRNSYIFGKGFLNQKHIAWTQSQITFVLLSLLLLSLPLLSFLRIKG